MLTCGAPITPVPLGVTSGTTPTASDLDRLAEAGTASSDYVVQTSRPWITYCEAVRRRPGCRLHDPLAMALLIEPDLQVDTDRLARHLVDVLGGSAPAGRARPGSRPI